MAKRLLDAKQPGSMIGIKPATLYKWAEEGRVPFYRLGRLIRFDEDEFWEWVKARRSRNSVINLGLQGNRKAYKRRT